MTKRIVTALVIFVALMMSLYAANIDRQIKTQQQNQADMKKKIQQYNAIAKQKSKESKTLLSQLSRLRKDANESESQMKDLEQKNSKLQASVNELNKSIVRVNESMNHIITMLKGRLAELYKHTPDENSISVIFSSGGPHEAVNTAYMLNIFARQDIEMFRELTERERELNEAKRRLEADKSQILKQTDELKKKQEEFDTAVRKTDNLLFPYL